MAYFNNELYLVGDETERLYKFNKSGGKIIGSVTAVGTLTQFGVVSEGIPTGLAVHNGTLYMAGGEHDALYTLDPSMGRATRVSQVTRFGNDETQPEGLSSVGGKLYMAGNRYNSLFRLITDPGEGTIGMRVAAENGPGGYGVGETGATGLATRNGQLYMVGQATDALYTVVTGTGSTRGRAHVLGKLPPPTPTL